MIEDCCWNYTRYYCKGGGCDCRCHRDRPDQPTACDHIEEMNRLRATIQRWEEFDFERDSPKRLVEHVLALMVERDRWQRRAEDAEAVIRAAQPPDSAGKGEA